MESLILHEHFSISVALSLKYLSRAKYIPKSINTFKNRHFTYREFEWEALNNGVETAELLCSSFGDEGKEESVISSMSEWEDADLGDFFLPKACLKELRNWNKTITVETLLRIYLSNKLSHQVKTLTCTSFQ